jgi:hypothetical protein
MYKCLCAVVVALVCQIRMFGDDISLGSDIQVRTNAAIEMNIWDRGRIYPAYIARDVIDRDGGVAIPGGSQVELIVREVGPGQYTLDLESISMNDQRYVVDSSGPQHNNFPRDDGGNGVIGAIAITTGEQVQTKGAKIRVPAGSLITFRLLEPLRVVNWGDPGYQQGSNHYHHEHDWYR